MKKSKNSLTFTAAILATVIGTAGLSGCSHHNPDRQSTEIESTSVSTNETHTDLKEKSEGENTHTKGRKKKYDSKNNRNPRVYGPPPSRFSDRDDD